jgi:hypothetical protein
LVHGRAELLNDLGGRGYEVSLERIADNFRDDLVNGKQIIHFSAAGCQQQNPAYADELERLAVERSAEPSQ